MSMTLLAIGLTIFAAHYLSIQFRRTNVPDVLILMIAGLVLGPITGWVTPDDFGKLGSVVATIALVVILFESGTSLDLRVMGASLATTGKLTFGCFALTAGIVTAFAYGVLELSPQPAVLLGLILAGTSSAVVIPMVESLRLGEKASTVLVLESALTDVLCIVGVFAMIQVITQGGVAPGKLIGNVLSALVFAAVIGWLGGVGWLLVLGKVRDFPNTISSTVAYAFIVYGLAEFLGFSGAIAAMTFGMSLTNTEALGFRRFKALNHDIATLTPMDIAFYREAVFLLKTYFFIYLGISIAFTGLMPVVAATGMMVMVFAMRLALVRVVCVAPDHSVRDAAITSMLAPKGLAAAVLATLPMQYGIAGAEVIRDTTFMVVLVSISLCAALVIAIRFAPVLGLYERLLGRHSVRPLPDTPEKDAAAEP
jgi:potassium/hydrogen antiporter